MDHGLTVGEIYGILHALQLAIMHEEKVTMVFGVYAVDRDSWNVEGCSNGSGRIHPSV